MFRRSVRGLALGVAVLAFGFSAPTRALTGKAEVAEFDRFGGWRGLHLGPGTGFFTTAERDGRHWLVSPDGNAFFMLALNHIDWDLTVANGVAGDYDDDPAVWATSVLEDMDAAGLNTVGHTVGEVARRILLRNNTVLPKTEQMCFANRFSTNLNFRYPDVFDETWFWRHCQNILDKADILPDDPWLVGYYTSEEVEYGDGLFSGEHANSWPIKIADQSPETDGKQAFVLEMQARYNDDVLSFDQVWGGDVKGTSVRFASWIDVEGFTKFRILDSDDPVGRDADELRFAVRIAEHYYPMVTASLRERDPNHLILGNRYTAEWNNMPCEILEVSGQYVDVISMLAFDLSRPKGQSNLERAHSCSGLPVIVADTKFVSPSSSIPDPFGHWVATHQDRGMGYERLLFHEAAKPWVIGFNWCNYLDKRSDRNQGLRDTDNREYWDWIYHFGRSTPEVYSIHQGAMETGFSRPPESLGERALQGPTP